MSPARSNNDFVLTEGRLRYFAAAESTVTLETRDAHVQVCTITFGRDGSIYVAFPYFPSLPGIVSEVELPPVLSGTVTLNLMKGGRTTSHHVKYTHHRSGVAQFSQTGKVRTEVRRNSFRLDGPIGHLFQIQLYHTGRLRPYVAAKGRSGRAYLHFRRTDGETEAVVISAQWRRKADILSNAIPLGGTVGPIAPIADRATPDSPAPYYLIGPPQGMGIDSHLLVLGCAPIDMLPNVTGPTMLFLGGWDLHEQVSGRPQPEQRGCLAFMFPIDNNDAVSRKIGSIDEAREQLRASVTQDPAEDALKFDSRKIES